MEELGLEPNFYAFRWFTTLLSREFELTEVLQLWDRILADTNRWEFLHCICAALVIRERRTLLTDDFGLAINILQNYPEPDLLHVMRLACLIREGAPLSSPGVQALLSPFRKRVESFDPVTGAGISFESVEESPPVSSTDGESSDASPSVARKRSLRKRVESVGNKMKGALRGIFKR